jgi:hypothetical protein
VTARPACVARESAPRTVDVEERVGENVIAELRRQWASTSALTSAHLRGSSLTRVYPALRVTFRVMTHVMTGPGCTALPPRGRRWCDERTGSTNAYTERFTREETP